jgi:hypothetical protein
MSVMGRAKRCIAWCVDWAHHDLPASRHVRTRPRDGNGIGKIACRDDEISLHGVVLRAGRRYDGDLWRQSLSSDKPTLFPE